MPTPLPPSSGVDRKRRTSASRTNTPNQKQRRRQTGKTPPLQSTSSRLPLFRLLIVWGVLVAGSVGMAVKLYQLQVVQADYLLNLAKKRQKISIPSITLRRPIVDRNNSVLAMDRPVYDLYAHPKWFDKLTKEQSAKGFKSPKQYVAAKLAPYIKRSVPEIEKQLNTRESGIKIAKALPEQTAQKIEQLWLNGLELEQHYSRFYPQQNLVADVVGFVNFERHGQAGVEYSQQQQLEHYYKPTPLRGIRRGGIISKTSIISYDIPQGLVDVDDKQLQLTVDIRIQRAAQESLSKQLQKFQAKRGSVIVMDARDGSILAMVEEPSYDPNQYYKSIELLKNWTLSDLYEPGSTFKPLNVAIALEAKAIAPNDIFPDPEMIEVGDRQIRNADPEDYTQLSVAGILQHSSNVGMVQIIQRMQPDQYYTWLKRLGLGQTVHMDLPFEASSQIKSQKQFVSSPIESATASFGQGFSLTPMQLVQLHGALANGGKLVTPHIVRGLFDAQGQSHWQPSLPAPRQIFSPQTAQTVLEMMETVVTQGSGKVAQIAGYRIAGKTGTAQKASHKGGYDSSAKITSFISIFPVDAPKYVVLAVVDEPSKKGAILRGSTTAAPIVKSVIDALISMERMPPSQPRFKPSSSSQKPGDKRQPDNQTTRQGEQQP